MPSLKAVNLATSSCKLINGYLQHLPYRSILLYFTSGSCTLLPPSGLICRDREE